MDFVHPGLLGGIALLGVPIALHLIMRQQPRRLEFPALRFVRNRLDANRRKLRLRHLLLLAMRALAVVLIAAGLARPSIKAVGGISEQEAPVAAAMVVDTSPRMDYLRDNKTRLQQAREITEAVLTKLPEGSEVTLVDSRPQAPADPIDAGLAQERVRRLESRTVSSPLWQRVEAAVEALEKSSLGRKEVYVFTDLTVPAWTVEPGDRLSQRLAKVEDLGVYLIDVGVDKPSNLALGEPRLESESLVQGRPWGVSIELISQGFEGERVVELYLTDDKGEFVRRGQESTSIAPGETKSIPFELNGLESGVHQAYVQIVADDALPHDDRRYFTVHARPSWKILILAQPPADARAFLFDQTLAPESERTSGRARFDDRIGDFGLLEREDLDGYSAVFLLDPPKLPDASWKALSAYAEEGGGVGIFLGPNLIPVSESITPAARALLPGGLSDFIARRPDGDLTFATDDAEHPLLARFRPLKGTALWEDFPVYRHWSFDTLDEGAATVIPYGDGRPALLEKPLGKGRVLTLTTTVSELDDIDDEDRWNRLQTGFEPWPFFMLTNELALYLVGSSAARMNYLAGETAVVDLPEGHRDGMVLLTTPIGDQLRQAVEPGRGALAVTATEQLGNYHAIELDAKEAANFGFSVNLPFEASQLERLDEADLPSIFGDVEFSLAHNLEEIDRTVQKGRVGRELFPWLIMLIAVLLAGEFALANWFYREPKS